MSKSTDFCFATKLNVANELKSSRRHRYWFITIDAKRCRRRGIVARNPSMRAGIRDTKGRQTASLLLFATGFLVFRTYIFIFHFIFCNHVSTFVRYFYNTFSTLQIMEFQYFLINSIIVFTIRNNDRMNDVNKHRQIKSVISFKFFNPLNPNL